MQSFFDSARQKITRTWVIVLAILLIAAFFRFYRLNEIPPGFNNDEAFNTLDVLNLLKGRFSIFFPANTGREPLWFYLNVASVALFGAIDRIKKERAQQHPQKLIPVEEGNADQGGFGAVVGADPQNGEEWRQQQKMNETNPARPFARHLHPRL